MLLSIEGDEATGKTTLAYSAPLPIVGFAFDMGIERALYGGRFVELFEHLNIKVVPYEKKDTPPTLDHQGEDILIFELPPPIQLDSVRVQGFKALWSYFIQLVAGAFTEPAICSIAVDTMTIARRVKAHAHLEALQDIPPQPGKTMRERLQQIEYGIVNDAIRDIYTTAAGVKKNFVATHHLTDERTDMVDKEGKVVQGALTGNRILEGLNHTYRFVDVAIRMEKKDKVLTGIISKLGYSLAQEGTPLIGPTWNSIVSLIEMGTGERIKLDRRAGNEVS